MQLGEMSENEKFTLDESNNPRPQPIVTKSDIESAMSEEDSDEELIIHKKKPKAKTVLESDSEDESFTVEKTLRETNAETDSQANALDSEVSDEEESKKQLSVQERQEQSDSESDEERAESKGSNEVTSNKKRRKKKIAVSPDSDESDVEKEDGVDDNEDSNEMEKLIHSNRDNSGNKIIKNDKLLDELFDAEGSSSDEENCEKKVETKREEDVEDEEEETEISAELKRKLAMMSAKGGAAKKTPAARKSKKSIKSMEDEKMELHSESQRLMREREVRMPYHNPKKLGLSVFLARTQQKQEALKTITTPGSWKNKPDAALLAKLEKEEKLDTHTGKSDLKERIELKLKDDTSSANIQEKDHGKETGQQSEEIDSVKKHLDLDELPDLIIENTTQNDITNTSGSSDKLQESNNIGDSSNKLLHLSNGSEQLVVQESVSLKTVGSPKRTIKSKGNCEGPEQDSGYVTTPLNSSEEDSNGASSPKQGNVENTDSDLVTANCDNSESVENIQNKTVKTELQNHESNVNIGDILNANELPEKTSNNEVNATPVTPEQSTVPTKKKLTPKLVNLANLPPAPSLSGGFDEFIDLSDDENNSCAPKEKTVPTGLQKLMDRVVQHSSKRKAKKAQDVEISTIVMDKGEEQEQKEQLKVEKFVYHIDGQEELDPKLKKPGAKLMKLKETLQERMAAEREKARQMKSQIMEMDNEEGYEDEEEAELTDESDTDGEEEDIIDEEEEEDEMDLDEYTEKEKMDKENNPFVDDEADDDDEEEEIEEQGLHLEFDTQDSQDGEESNMEAQKKNKGFLDKAMSKTKSLDLFDEEANTESPTISQKSNSDSVDISERPFEQLSQGNKPVLEDSQENFTQDLQNHDKEEGHTTNSSHSLFKESSFNNSMDSSFELMGSMIPAGQRMRKKSGQNDSPCSKSSYSSKKSSIRMPIENTQDLFNLSTQSPSSCSKQHSQDFNFNLNESESNLLDEDGLIKMEKSSKKNPRRQLLMHEKDNVDPEDEMLGLCSGQFTEVNKNSSQKKLFEDDEEPELGGTQELLGLCSGHFSEKSSTDAPSSQQSNTSSPKLSGTQPFEVGDSVSNIPGTQGDMNELLGLCSGVFSDKSNDVVKDQLKDTQEVPYSPEKAIIKRKKAKAIPEDDDFEIVDGKNSEDEQEEALDSDEEVESNKENQKNFSSLFSKKKKLRQEFVDEEAELSGSEAESDEDYDLNEEDDVLEEEEGDQDLMMSEEELRNQVGRVHLKSVIDSDKKQIRLMQEMYLQDGDLHSDGSGRARRFRWRNIDDDTQDDLFNNASDEELGEDEIEQQEKWRLERHEREKFLEEQKEKDQQDEDSQTIKLGKVCFKPKKVLSAKSTKSDSAPLAQTENVEPLQPKKSAPPTPPGLFKKPSLKLSKAGSFLNRSNQALQKIAEMSKGNVTSNINGPRSSSRGFLFNTLSTEEKETQEENKPQVKRANSTPLQQPVMKKPRLERTNSIPKNSIFNLMN